MVLDLNNAVDRVRLAIADTNVPSFLSDAEIQYYLNKHSNNEVSTVKSCAFVILGKLSLTSTNSRVDVLQEDRRQIAGDYLTFIKLAITNPLTALMNIRTIAGGVSLSDMAANNANPDNNIVKTFKPEEERLDSSMDKDYRKYYGD